MSWPAIKWSQRTSDACMKDKIAIWSRLEKQDEDPTFQLEQRHSVKYKKQTVTETRLVRHGWHLSFDFETFENLQDLLKVPRGQR